MTHSHPVQYLVTVSRNNHVRHRQMATTREEAEELASRFEQVSGAVAEISEVHDPREVDLMTHTREILEDIPLRTPKGPNET